MSKYRNQLPQMTDQFFLTDAGLETELVFHDGLELPLFAAFGLMNSEEGSRRLHDYYSTYGELARKYGHGAVLETPTWRASSDWATQLGFDRDALAELNRKSVALLEQVRDRFETEETQIVISGSIGPRGDGYDPERLLTSDESEAYHREQIGVFAQTSADLVTALTMTHPGEAIGIVRSARAASMPAVISFTVETDGKLPTGQAIGDAIRTVDDATDSYAAYFAINCAHPTHFDRVLDGPDAAEWRDRLHMLRPNASSKSHAELDESTELDDGNPHEFGEQCRSLREKLPNLNVIGGCCGTDIRHVEAIARLQ